MFTKTVDFLVVGAGILGLNIALFLKKDFPDCSVAIIEKEQQPGLHASGRNSGVLHAGFYYSKNSMKARFCKEGNQQLTEYCQEKKIAINHCGKLVVASTEDQLSDLDELLFRSRANNIELFAVDEQGAKDIEPRVITFQKALFSPNTSTVSPSAVISAIVDDVKDIGIDIWTNTAFVGRGNNTVVKTSQGDILAGYVVNAAGLYADRIALDYGFSQNYRVIPFKGLYLYANSSSARLNTNIYPVPNLKQPFLGVHFTVDVEGRTKIGPTAIPALWREQYGGMKNFKLSEMIDILIRDAGLFIQNDFDFRKVAIEEMKKRSRTKMVDLAKHMVEGIEQDLYTTWGKPGIRAQLINIQKRKLEMDFIFEGDNRSFHVLNAVSPAFTCSMPFSRFLVDHIIKLMG